MARKVGQREEEEVESEAVWNRERGEASPPGGRQDVAVTDVEVMHICTVNWAQIMVVGGVPDSGEAVGQRASYHKEVKEPTPSPTDYASKLSSNHLTQGSHKVLTVQIISVHSGDQEAIKQKANDIRIASSVRCAHGLLPYGPQNNQTFFLSETTGERIAYESQRHNTLALTGQLPLAIFVTL
ncbi:hypothetical protein STEG23_003747, partial [Scotinomys teguina]